jgi:hypothetical protein
MHVIKNQLQKVAVPKFELWKYFGLDYLKNERYVVSTTIIHVVVFRVMTPSSNVVRYQRFGGLGLHRVPLFFSPFRSSSPAPQFVADRN